MNFMHISKNSLTIDDSVFWPNPRTTEFLKFIKGYTRFFEFSSFLVWKDEPWHENLLNTVYTQSLLYTNESEIHERKRTKFVAAVADLGGLYALLMAIFATMYWLFAEPFRDLHLAISFNRMKNQICR